MEINSMILPCYGKSVDTLHITYYTKLLKIESLILCPSGVKGGTISSCPIALHHLMKDDGLAAGFYAVGQQNAGNPALSVSTSDFPFITVCYFLSLFLPHEMASYTKFSL
jgi:hypothetical protein